MGLQFGDYRGRIHKFIASIKDLSHKAGKCQIQNIA